MPQGVVDSLMANGNILPYSFVKLDTTTPFKVVQAAANTDIPIGVSSEQVDVPPIPQSTGTQYAAVAGEMLKVYRTGARCKLKIGAGGCTAGDRLTSDASGNGVTASGTNYYGAVALDTRVSGELCDVMVTEPAVFS